MVETPWVAKSDCVGSNPKSTSAFWRHFSKKVRMKLKFGTAFHSQTDGKIERVNGVLKQNLRTLVGADQGDWVDHMGPRKLSYNVAVHAATKEFFSRWLVESNSSGAKRKI